MFSIFKREQGFYRKLIALALPIIIQNLITNSLGLVDTFMVGVLGEGPLAGVTLANVPIFVVQLMMFGVQSGSSVLISQYKGKGDMNSINRVMGLGMYSAGTITLIFALLLTFIPHQFMSLFGNDPEIIEIAAGYARIVGWSYFFDSFVQIYNGTHRAMGEPRRGMYILCVSMVVNTFLNWVLIFGNLGAPAMGVQGAAIATLIARTLEWVMIGIHMKRTTYFKMRMKAVLLPGRRALRSCLRYATPVIANEAFWGIGTGLYPTIMGHMEGSQEILAAYTIVGNVNTLCMVTIFGIAYTAAIMIGREIGAGNKDQVYSVGLALDMLSVLVGVVMTAILLVFAFGIGPRFVFPVFHLSAGAASVATVMLAIQGAIAPIRYFNTTNIVGVLRGGGDVTMATVIDLSALWLVSLPWAAVCGLVIHTGVFWVYFAIAVEQAGKFCTGMWRLRSGKWVHDLTRNEIGE